MNIWANAVITEKGLALLAKLTQGNTLDIIEAVTGAGFVAPGLLLKQTEVMDPRQTLKSRPVSYPDTGRCDLPLCLTNEGITVGYEVTQVGVFANDPDEGKILFFLAQSVTSDIGTTVPSETEMPGYSAEWTFRIQYGQADSVNVTVDPANTVSPAELEQYIDEEFVPITFAQIDELAGIYGGGYIGSGSTDGTSGVGTLDHSQLLNRNIANQHTIESITGLEEALTDAEGTELASDDIEAVWNNS